MSEALDELIEEYKVLRRRDGIGHLELVKLEHRIWDQLKLDRGKGFTKTAAGERRDWFHGLFSEEFGGRVSDYEARASIFNAGTWAHGVFESVDRGYLKMSAATRAIRDAKYLARANQIDLDIALKAALSGLGQQPKKTGRTSIQPKDDSSLPSVSSDFGKSQVTNSKEFLRRLNLLAGSFISSAFEGVYIDEYHKTRIITDFKDSTDLLVEELRTTINRVKTGTKDDGIREVGEANFSWACEVLGFSYSFGQQINMKTIKKRKNKRSLELHPDRNPDDKAAKAEFERVQEAYALLVQYDGKNNRRA